MREEEKGAKSDVIKILLQQLVFETWAQSCNLFFSERAMGRCALGSNCTGVVVNFPDRFKSRYKPERHAKLTHICMSHFHKVEKELNARIRIKEETAEGEEEVKHLSCILFYIFCRARRNWRIPILYGTGSSRTGKTDATLFWSPLDDFSDRQIQGPIRRISRNRGPNFDLAPWSQHNDFGGGARPYYSTSYRYRQII